MKRANHEGSLDTLPSGKVRFKAKVNGTLVCGSARNSKREALKSLRDKIAAHLHGPASDVPSLNDYTFNLLQGPLRTDLAPKTWELYELIFRRELQDHPIGVTPLDQITAADCDAWMRGLKTREGRPVQPSTAKRYAGFVGAVLERAVNVDGWTDKNPMKGIKKPQPQEAEVTILSGVQCARLLSMFEGRYKTALLLMLHGLGPAEACGLRFEDFDGEGITIRRQNQRIGNKDVIREKLKTDRRRAWIPVSADLKKLLRGGSGYVLATASGTPTATNNLRRAMTSTLKGTEFDGLTPYDLRHTFGMNLLENGVDPRTAAELMRHSPEMLLKVYARSRKELKVSAIARLSYATDYATQGERTA